MPQKLGNGGHSLEKYDTSTGKYIEDGKPNEYYNNPNELQNTPNKNNLGNELSDGQKEYFKNSKIKDENGNLKIMYHGTKRVDRIGNRFDPDKATSGPMAFFTDNYDIAESYSKNKEDTSIFYDDYNDYSKWFKYIDNGKITPIDINTAWEKLSFSQRKYIKEIASKITFDDDWENIIIDENNKNGLGDLDHKIKNNNGNYLAALVDEWLTDGNLFDNEEKFMDVLKFLKIDNLFEYDSPKMDNSGVFKVYLDIQNPFNTSKLDENFINEIENYSKTIKNENIPQQLGADPWDKRTRTPEVWIKSLKEDFLNNTSLVWTSIPDWVTDFLKSKKYDGIIDSGGKFGGNKHEVGIPFYSNQIKSIENKNPTNSDDIYDEENNTMKLFGL